MQLRGHLRVATHRMAGLGVYSCRHLMSLGHGVIVTSHLHRFSCELMAPVEDAKRLDTILSPSVLAKEIILPNRNRQWATASSLDTRSVGRVSSTGNAG